MNWIKYLGVLLIFCVFSMQISVAQTNKKELVYKIDVKDEINPTMVRAFQKGFAAAEELHANLILLHMNTYGGLVISADSIRTRILNSKIPVIVFIDNNAASAGALISIACDSIYMRPGANIGAATVVNENAQAMPDKYQSYMRSTMRSTAEAKGRNPLVAEAMVDPDVYIEGVIDTGKVLTFTANEAMKNGYCEGIANDFHEVLDRYGLKNYKVEVLQLTALDKLMGFLLNPFFHGILIMLIIGGIWFELQTPGLGVPSAVALLAALLYFAPLYLEGLAEHWEILLFIIGIILIIIEVFVIPGFGVTGISGIILVFAGLILSLLGNVRFNFEPVSGDDFGSAFLLVVISVFVAIIFSFYTTKKLFASRKLGFALYSENHKDMGYIVGDSSYKELIGKEGIAYTVLRPAGKVMIEDEIYDAVAENDYIEKDLKIRVVGYHSNQLFVEKYDYLKDGNL